MAGAGGRRSSDTPQYVGGSSDLRYQQQTRERLKAEAYRRWGLRLAVLMVLAFAYYMWGEQVINLVTRKGKAAVTTVERTGKGMKSAAEERAGSNLMEDE